MRILVHHGPKLNLLGTHEPQVRGRVTTAQIGAQLALLRADASASAGA